MIAGVAAGIAQVLVGHPLDTYKVRMQNLSASAKKGGASASRIHFGKPYAGWRYPLASAMAVNGILFPTYQRARDATGSPFLGGACAGAVVTPIVFLSDCFKVSRQVGKSGSVSFSRGAATTLARESLAFAIYFETYERARSGSLELHPLAAGACAGVTNWLATYPLDVMRTRQIAQGVTAREAFLQGSLYKGIGFCLARAVVVNAAIFATYEAVSSAVATTGSSPSSV